MTGLDRESIEARFAAQQAGAVARRTTFGLAERRAALGDLRAAIRRFEPAITAAMMEDFQKPAVEVALTEILPLLTEIDHTRRALRGWMRPRRKAPTLATLGTRARIRPEPRGTALIISPWNYPLNLALGPLIPALAAGNSAVLKPSELAPATSAVIARLVAETFPPELVTVVEGGQQAAEVLLGLPFDHIFFTGSPRVGKIVMARAAEHLSSVTLELGGKSPTIVGPGADLEQAAKWVAFGKFANAGQTCIAPDHLYVHEEVRAPFIAALRARIARAYGEGPHSPHLAGIVSPHHTARLTGMVDEARTGGAEVIHGGERDGQRLAPTLIEAVTPEMTLDREEIFGPVLPILPYRDIAEVIDRINARPKPLALYLFEKDRALVDRVIAATSSGGVGVNLTLMHFSHARLPFGGVGNSGMGANHGEHGFRAFSHERAVLENRASPISLMFPPYAGGMRALLRVVRRVVG